MVENVGIGKFGGRYQAIAGKVAPTKLTRTAQISVAAQPVERYSTTILLSGVPAGKKNRIRFLIPIPADVSWLQTAAVRAPIRVDSAAEFAANSHREKSTIPRINCTKNNKTKAISTAAAPACLDVGRVAKFGKSRIFIMA
jgi:hypothetical protein